MAKTIWARVGMRVEISDTEYEKLKREASDHNEDNYSRGIFDDIDVPDWLKEKYQKDGAVDGDSYIPGDSWCWGENDNMDKIKLYNIEWDTDEEYIPDLPTEVIIDNPTKEMCESVGGFDDVLADYLSDNFGYCVFGFNADFC